MTTANPETLETAALAVTGLGGLVSVHTADPGATGANEATGGTPAYARQTTTWTGGAADGIVTGSEVSIDLPPGTYTHGGIWTSGGVWVEGNAFPSPVVLGAQGVLKITPTHTQT